MLDLIYISVFKFFGWRLVGEIPSTLKKSIIIVAPHAEWVDFLLGLFARASLRTKICFLGKAELFNGVFGFILDGSAENPLIDLVTMGWLIQSWKCLMPVKVCT